MSEKALLLRSQDVEPRRLDVLAATIRDHHRGVQDGLRRTFEHAVAAGEALREAREMVPTGLWQSWTQENVALSQPTVSLYIRVARFRNELELVGVGSVSEAQSYLRQNGLVVELARRPAGEEVHEQIRVLCEQGVPRQQIADRVGVSRQTVGRVLRTPIGQRTARREAMKALPPAEPLAEITDSMIEGMTRWLAARVKLPLTDQTRSVATEALRVALNYRAKEHGNRLNYEDGESA